MNNNILYIMSNENIYKCLNIENIIGYNYNFFTNKIICNLYNNNLNDIKFKKYKTYYFILDSGSSEFEYWVFESFIFFNLLIKLNNTHKNIKILTNPNRQKYITWFLDFFNIVNDVVYEIANYNNIVFSPNVYNINYLHQLDNDIILNYHLNEYINYVRNNIHISSSPISITLVSNYANNNKTRIIDDKIVNLIINAKGMILMDGNIKNDFTILSNSDNIMMYYGPSYYFYCICLENKTINLIVDDYHCENGIHTHHCNNPYLNHLNELIKKNNKVNIINTQDLLKLI